MKNPYADMKPWVIVVLWIAKLIACVMLGMAAYDKLLGGETAVATFEALDMEPHGRYAIGGLEALAVVLILIPQSAVYGALLGLGVMLGAVIGHLTDLGIDGLEMALLVAACCVVVLYIRRRDAEFLENLVDR